MQKQFSMAFWRFFHLLYDSQQLPMLPLRADTAGDRFPGNDRNTVAGQDAIAL
jgi:hypothetical protein